MDPASEKRRLRREVGALRRAIPPVQAQAASQAVASHLMASPELLRAERVALYVALPDELPTEALCDAVRRAGKRILLPRLASGGRLEFAQAPRFEDLRVGRFGVREPPPEVPQESPERGDLVVLPGVAFDREGYRLGRGAGFYDRVFPPSLVAGPLLFGVALEVQLVEVLPREAWDRRMDAVVTERGVWRTTRAREE